jgi:hypothetical protein
MYGYQRSKDQDEILEKARRRAWEIYTFMKNYDIDTSEIRPELKRFFRSHEVHVSLAIMAQDDGDIAEAINRWELAIDEEAKENKDPKKRSSLWLTVAELEKARGNEEKYRKVWRESISVFEEAKNYERAVEAAEKAELPDEVERLRKALVNHLESSGRFKEAWREAKKAGLSQKAAYYSRIIALKELAHRHDRIYAMQEAESPPPVEKAIKVVVEDAYPKERRKLLETILRKDVHPFFDHALANHLMFSISQLDLRDRLPELLDEDSATLDSYLWRAEQLESNGYASKGLLELASCSRWYDPSLCRHTYDQEFAEFARDKITKAIEKAPPEDRGTLLKILLEREDLHPFFDYAMQAIEHCKKGWVVSRLTTALQLEPAKLDQYLAGLKATENSSGIPDGRFFEIKIKEDSLEDFEKHYDELSAALTSPGSYYPRQTFATRVIETKRQDGMKKGIKDRVEREIDAVLYLFNQLYSLFQVKAFQINDKKRAEVIQDVLDEWKNKQRNFVGDELLKAMQRFNFEKFFYGKDKTDLPVRQYLDGYSRYPGSKRFVFSDKPDLVLTRLVEEEYYAGKDDPKEEVVGQIERLRMGATTQFSFDDLRIEYNPSRLDDIFTLIPKECTSNRGKYQKYGYRHMHDPSIQIVAANLYEKGRYQGTVGKAFLADCTDTRGKRLLYVDGVIMLQDIADMLRSPTAEAEWMPMYTKAIIEIALQRQYEDILVNASHKLAQASVWEYIHHFARFLGMEEDKYTYKQLKIHPSTNIKTLAKDGFKLEEETARKNCHEIVKDDSGYRKEHILEGFWINHHNPPHPQGDRDAQVCSFIPHRDHRELPQINDGRGYVIGFRRNARERARKFDEIYGKEYGHIKL